MTNENTLTPESLRAIRNKYLAVFGVLVIGTIVTVTMYYVHFEYVWQTVTVALLIASIKATSVAAVFMHLSHAEKPLVILLFFTGIFLAAMLGFLVYSEFSVPGAT